MTESQQVHIPVQCPHSIGFHASDIVAGIAGIVVGIALNKSGNCTAKWFVLLVCKDLYVQATYKRVVHGLHTKSILHVYKVQYGTNNNLSQKIL